MLKTPMTNCTHLWRGLAAGCHSKNIVVMGDANVCSTKWNEANFKLKAIAEEIKGVVSIEFSPLGSINTNNGYQLHNGDYC